MWHVKSQQRRRGKHDPSNPRIPSKLCSIRQRSQLTIRDITPQEVPIFLWMNHIKGNHCDEHQQRIKNIYIYLMMQKISIVALDILRQAEDGADHNQEACRIQHV